MLYKEFEAKYLGKTLDYDRVYGAQCVDLARGYASQVFGIETGSFGGTAWSGWIRLSSDNRFNAYANNGKFTIPPIGSIIFFSPRSMGQKYGHVAICAYAQAGGTMIDVLEQNGGSGNGDGKGANVIRIHSYPMNKVEGWILPRR